MSGPSAATVPASARARWTRFAAPSRFYAMAAVCLPWLWFCALGLGAAGLFVALAVAPVDAVQGEVYRLMFIHVPAAWLSMLIYVAMAAWGAIGWIFRARMASMLAQALAPTGAGFTFIALVTGALWGRPTWGTWWVWDARLTSELILLLLYVGQISLTEAIDDPQRADVAGAVLGLIGVANVPVIYFSVTWWNTLHQGASIGLRSGVHLAAPMAVALLLMTLALWAYVLAAVLMRAQALVLEREPHARWLQRLHGPEGAR